MTVATSNTDLDPFQLLEQAHSEADFAPHKDTLPGNTPALWKRFFAVNGRFIDRTVLRVMEFLFNWGTKPSDKDNVPQHLKQVVDLYSSHELLNEPEGFFLPSDSPERMRMCELDEFADGKRLGITFESVYETFDEDFADEYYSYLGNESCRFHYWRHADGPRPTIICAHSWCGGWLWLEEKFLDARRFYDRGFNIAFITLPFHGKRTPEQAVFSGQLFPSIDLQLTIEAFGQSMHDLNSLLHWIREDQGDQPVGMLGVSLGGFLSALMASLESELSFCIPIIAPASFADILWFHGEDKTLQEAALEQGINLGDLRELLGVFCPLNYSLEIDKDNIFIVAGMGDEVVPASHSIALWEHWGKPNMEWFPGSHMLHVGRSNYLGSISEWLTSRFLD